MPMLSRPDKLYRLFADLAVGHRTHQHVHDRSALRQSWHGSVDVGDNGGLQLHVSAAGDSHACPPTTDATTLWLVTGTGSPTLATPGGLPILYTLPVR